MKNRQQQTEPAASEDPAQQQPQPQPQENAPAQSQQDPRDQPEPQQQEASHQEGVPGDQGEWTDEAQQAAAPATDDDS